MKNESIATVNPGRRGFLTALATLAALIGGGLLWRPAATPQVAKRGPRELSLQQIDDYYQPHDLAG